MSKVFLVKVSECGSYAENCDYECCRNVACFTDKDKAEELVAALGDSSGIEVMESDPPVEAVVWTRHYVTIDENGNVLTHESDLMVGKAERAHYAYSSFDAVIAWGVGPDLESAHGEALENLPEMKRMLDSIRAGRKREAEAEAAGAEAEAASREARWSELKAQFAKSGLLIEEMTPEVVTEPNRPGGEPE